MKNNTTISVSYIFESNDESPIEVLIGEPTAEQKTIEQKTYFEDETKDNQ